MSAHGLALLPIIALVLFSLYRRYRSHIGPQLIRPRRMMLRVALFGVIAVVVALQPLGLNSWLALAAGLAAGAALGLLSLHHTRFETREAQHYYIPNIYIGLAVSALFVLRLGWRMMVVYPRMQQGGAALAAQGGSGPMASLGGPQNLPTVALLGVVIGYYALYYIGVLILSNRAVAAQPAAPAPAPADKPG